MFKRIMSMCSISHIVGETLNPKCLYSKSTNKILLQKEEM